MNTGVPLRKMTATLDAGVHYRLGLAEGPVELTPFIGQHFGLRHTGLLTCIACGERVPKFYGQGFCFPCLRSAPEAAECIVRPELCEAHLGRGRNVAWEQEHHATEHVVYLSYTGGVKVGVTRATQVPVRWIDQGAVAALEIARVPYRQLAGRIEVALKEHFADRTDWRAMLRPVVPRTDLLLEARERLSDALPDEFGKFLIHDAAPTLIDYAVLEWPPKVSSVQLAKTPLVEGRLVGIKGQYLIWADGRVLNVRNHSGYHVELV